MKVAFVGHRKIMDLQKIKNSLYRVIETLIADKQANLFLFGDRGEFNDLCYEVVTKMKEKYPYIQRIYFRSKYEEISALYEKYLLTLYERTEFSKQVHNAGVASYIKRNEAMIDACDVIVVYYDESYVSSVKSRRKKSGTALAVNYAKRKGKKVINTLEDDNRNG